MQDPLCAWRMYSYIGIRSWTHSSVHPSSGMEEGLKMLDGRARSAGVSRNWSVLYVSYLEVTLAEGVYKLYVVYRRQEERQRSGILGTEAGSRDDGCNNVGSCCCYRRFIRTIARPINKSAPQALSTVVRLSARSGSHPFPSVSQQRRARSQPTQLDESPAFIRDARGIPWGRFLYPLSYLSVSSDALNRITSMRDQTGLTRLRCPGVLGIAFRSNNI